MGLDSNQVIVAKSAFLSKPTPWIIKVTKSSNTVFLTLEAKGSPEAGDMDVKANRRLLNDLSKTVQDKNQGSTEEELN